MPDNNFMTKLSFPVSQNLYQKYQDFWIKYYFKYVLPKVQKTSLEGIILDLTELPLKIRNRILNVGYEEHEKQMCRDFLTSEDSVVEVGGAIGFISLYCQKRLGIKSYLTIEANPATVELLKKNYALNHVTPNVLNVALGDKEGTIDLDIGNDFWENSVVPGGGSDRSKTIQVKSVPLPMLLKLAPRTPNVLIIDIEGAEKFINFADLPSTIEKIIIELHPAVLGQAATYDIVSTLITAGFKVAREEGDTFAFLKKSPDRKDS
jgi:FkbM family methyltransferase